MLVAENQSRSADFEQWELAGLVYDGHRLRFSLASDSNSIHLEDIKHDWYFKSILEHIVSHTKV